MNKETVQTGSKASLELWIDCLPAECRSEYQIEEWDCDSGYRIVRIEEKPKKDKK